MTLYKSAEPSVVISPGGRYRYWLRREVAARTGTVCFVMLNPSTADGTKDDPTVRRCRGFVELWGCGALVIVNLFATRTTYPGELAARGAYAAEGPENLGYVRAAVTTSDFTVAAWGAHPLARRLPSKARDYLATTENLYCLGATRDGSPRHPLYVRADQAPVPWPPVTNQDAS